MPVGGLRFVDSHVISTMRQAGSGAVWRNAQKKAWVLNLSGPSLGGRERVLWITCYAAGSTSSFRAVAGWASAMVISWTGTISGVSIPSTVTIAK